MFVTGVFVLFCFDVVLMQSAVSLQKKGLCSVNVKAGNCKAYFPSFYYDAESDQCECFVYTGCGGNENRFEYIEECTQTCGVAPENQKISDACRLIFKGTQTLDELLSFYDTPILDIDLRQNPESPSSSSPSPSQVPITNPALPQPLPPNVPFPQPFPSRIFPVRPSTIISSIPRPSTIISSIPRPSNIASRLVDFFRPATHSWQKT
ncbi:Kunitz-type serine protease inhibitor [Armadillidium nasatum]|uniref:Kunitz-type serine protease inhibitor n=1 Tax=Armadillidium nasatum TaxID=96803 RepID=A0A5N5SYM3_9CRUS|nr:Kunitz-type serine protease inhibitor [Armadillidium nasatum]